MSGRNVAAFLVHCSASILFLVFLNASQPFIIHQLDARRNKAPNAAPDRTGSLSGSLIFYDELLSTVVSLVWGALAEIIGLAAVTSTSYLFIALGLASYTLPSKPWPDLVPARLIFALGGSGATSMLSAILSELSGSHTTSQKLASQPLASGPLTEDADSETASEATLRPQSGHNGREASVDAGVTDEREALIGSPPDALSRTSKGKSRHGRAAAVAGIFTGIGALIAVFVLVRLPQKIAEYLEAQRPSEPSSTSGGHHDGIADDVMLRRATVVTFGIVAALALLVAAVTALGLRTDRRYSSVRSGRALSEETSTQQQADYGALHDSTVALVEDSRQARRARLRQRLDRRSHSSWTRVIRSHIHRFVRGSVGGFRMAGRVQSAGASADELERVRWQSGLARELRMAYLGGALARAFTIGTTAFLPLLVTHHYYTSGLCRKLPSPNPDAPLPGDELKKLCRSAFTATAILGGTAQLTALLASPVMGLLCDLLSPTTTISLTSAAGAAGFYLLGVGTAGFGGDRQTGEEVPDPLGAVSIAAAVLIGVGQIGAIVASLAGCARARALVQDHAEPSGTAGAGGDEAASGSATLVPGRNATGNMETTGKDEAGQGAGAIAGAYTCTGSLSILLISKLGGFLFDLYVPSPFLLIGGFSALVSICGFATTLSMHLKST